MSYSFGDKDIEKISKVLGAKPKKAENSWTWSLRNPKNNQALILTIYNEVQLSETEKGSIVSAQTQHGYYELHDCVGYLVFEPDETIFAQLEGNRVSSLIVGKECSCSLYSNIRKDMLNASFENLDPAVLLSAMQLSLAESIIEGELNE